MAWEVLYNFEHGADGWVLVRLSEVLAFIGVTTEHITNALARSGLPKDCK